MMEALIAAFAALTIQASAADFAKACQDYQAENGGSADCECLGEKIAADDALAAEMMTLTTPEDVAGASDEFKAAVMSCSEEAE